MGPPRWPGTTSPQAVGDQGLRPQFEDLYRAQYRPLLRLALALVGDAHAAEDVVQDAFVALYRQWPRVSGYDDPMAWLRRVVSNRAASRWRRVAAEVRALARLGSRPSPPVDLVPRDEAVWATVRSLPARQARAVALTYVADLPLSELAATLGVSETTAKTHLRRARATLARRLAPTEERP